MSDAFYKSYCATIRKVYGEKYVPSREQWNAMCSTPRTPQRRLSDVEFDHQQEAAGDR